MTKGYQVIVDGAPIDRDEVFIRKEKAQARAFALADVLPLSHVAVRLVTVVG